MQPLPPQAKKLIFLSNLFGIGGAVVGGFLAFGTNFIENTLKAANVDPAVPFILLSIFIIFVCILLANWIYSTLLYHSFSYEVADDHITVESGVLYITKETIPYERLQDVVISRSLLARLLGLSSVIIQNANNNISFSGKATNGLTIPGLPAADAEALRADILNRHKLVSRGT